MFENRIVNLVDLPDIPPRTADVDEKLKLVYAVLDDLIVALCANYEDVLVEFQVKAK